MHNYGDKPVKLEVTRLVLGNAVEVGAEGVMKKLNAREEGWGLAGGYPAWWYWYSWPSGWYHLNGVGRFTWNVELEPDKGITLPYSWHYYWRN